MERTGDSDARSDVPTSDKFYIPAASASGRLGRVERYLARLFAHHGAVPIPESYNE